MTASTARDGDKLYPLQTHAEPIEIRETKISHVAHSDPPLILIWSSIFIFEKAVIIHDSCLVKIYHASKLDRWFLELKVIFHWLCIDGFILHKHLRHIWLPQRIGRTDRQGVIIAGVRFTWKRTVTGTCADSLHGSGWGWRDREIWKRTVTGRKQSNRRIAVTHACWGENDILFNLGLFVHISTSIPAQTSIQLCLLSDELGLALGDSHG